MSEDDEKNAEFEISSAGTRAPVRWWFAALETGASAIVVAILLHLLSHSGQKYETNWIIISVLPIVAWLFFSGRLASLKAFGVELQAAIRRASNQRIQPDHKISYEHVDSQPKQDIEKIPQYIAREVPAISFQLGKTGYYSVDALKSYLEGLLPYPFFKYVVFNHPDSTFAGIVPARTLYTIATTGEGAHTGYRRIQEIIEQDRIHDLSGVVEKSFALKTTDTKRDAVEKFNHIDADELPVINTKGKLVGILSRGKLLSDLLGSILRAADEGA